MAIGATRRIRVPRGGQPEGSDRQWAAVEANTRLKSASDASDRALLARMRLLSGSSQSLQGDYAENGVGRHYCADVGVRQGCVGTVVPTYGRGASPAAK